MPEEKGDWLPALDHASIPDERHVDRVPVLLFPKVARRSRRSAVRNPRANRCNEKDAVPSLLPY